MLNTSYLLLLLISAVVLPNVVALVTKLKAPPEVKGWTLAVLAAITGLVAELINAGGTDGFNWTAALTRAILALAAGHLAYTSGLIKPVAVPLANATATTGIGKPTDYAPAA